MMCKVATALRKERQINRVDEGLIYHATLVLILFYCVCLAADYKIKGSTAAKSTSTLEPNVFSPFNLR